MAAQKKGQSLVRVAEAPKSSTGPAPDNLVTGRVFLLTDGACASACLDFTDVVRRLPNVTHVGLPTSADAVYIGWPGGVMSDAAITAWIAQLASAP